MVDTSIGQTEDGPSTGRYRTLSSGFAVPTQSTFHPPVQNRVESDPALVEAIGNMNAAMVKMMGRIDEMEKKLTKSHKYLRHRIRMNTPGKPLPHPLANSPIKMLLNKKKEDFETSGKSLNQVPSPEMSNEDIQETRTDQPLRSPSGSHRVSSLPLVSNAIGNHVDDEKPRPGAEKLENSDSDSSLTSSRCTVHSDEDQVNPKELFNRPKPAQSPIRPTSAGVVRSAPAIVSQRERPQSANPKTPSTPGSKSLNGPPKSLLSDIWN